MPQPNKCGLIGKGAGRLGIEIPAWTVVLGCGCGFDGKWAVFWPIM